MDPGKLPAGAFRRLAARGFHAVRSIPPTPSLTAVSHITHVTGALPEVTGIVSNLMRDFSRPFPRTISGFDAPIRAETLWQAARRQGKRVGVMLYGVATCPWVTDGQGLYGFGGEPYHGFNNNNTENVLQIGSLRPPP